MRRNPSVIKKTRMVESCISGYVVQEQRVAKTQKHCTTARTEIRIVGLMNKQQYSLLKASYGMFALLVGSLVIARLHQ